MKASLKLVSLIIGCSLLIVSCKKDAGDGGTSAITGKVTGINYYGSNGSEAKQEVTQIILPNGNQIDDGDYILINTPDGGTLYYIWFKWNNGVQPDPGLAGRTVIQVVYDYTQSNATVTANTLTAINAIASADFTASINNDILTLVNKATGEVTDADELSSKLLVDTQVQGKVSIAGGSSFTKGAMADERVYIVYGDDDFYSDNVRTDGNGNFEFKHLNRGMYTVYVFSKDSTNLNNSLIQLESTVEITAKKSVIDAGQFYIVK